MELAIDAGADDVDIAEDGSVEVVTTPEDFLAVKDALNESRFRARQCGDSHAAAEL